MAEEQQDLELSETLLQELKESFDIFDKDHNGHISKDELGAVMRSLGDNPTSKQLDEMINEVDSKDDPNGMIEFDEFCRMMSKHHRSEEDELEEVKESFKIFDKDGNGFISVEELIEVLSALGAEPFPREEAEEMVRDIDTNGDGKICYEEYAKKMTAK